MRRVLIASGAMKIDELQQDERIALGALIRLTLRSDGDFTEAEEETLNALGESHLGGAPAMWSLISASAQACPSDAAMRASAEKVTRAEARALILGIVREVAAGDEVSDDEATLIEWLEQAWA